MKFKYGELFCGPGGMSLGAHQASFKQGATKHSIVHEWASDVDQNSCNTFIHNICPNKPESVFCSDVNDLSIRKNSRCLSPIDIFGYGFPCNDFSLVGEQKGFLGNFGPLYSYGLKVMNAYNPKAFVAENVSGISSANSYEAFKKIILDLENCGNGYDVSFQKYKAEEYGVPQSRHRIVIVGIRKDLKKTFIHPKPTHIGKFINSRTALEEPPISDEAFNNIQSVIRPLTIERLNHIKPGQNVWNADLPEHLKLNVKGATLSQIYKRLDPNKPSYTITGSGGGGTYCYHYKEPRPLTNRERARLQTFPDNFEFKGGYGSVRKQIGMAVPPKLAKIVFNALLRQLV